MRHTPFLDHLRALFGPQARPQAESLGASARETYRVLKSLASLNWLGVVTAKLDTIGSMRRRGYGSSTRSITRHIAQLEALGLVARLRQRAQDGAPAFQPLVVFEMRRDRAHAGPEALERTLCGEERPPSRMRWAVGSSPWLQGVVVGKVKLNRSLRCLRRSTSELLMALRGWARRTGGTSRPPCKPRREPEPTPTTDALSRLLAAGVGRDLAIRVVDAHIALLRARACRPRAPVAACPA